MRFSSFGFRPLHEKARAPAGLFLWRLFPARQNAFANNAPLNVHYGGGKIFQTPQSIFASLEL
jgi:hypothetical protein